MAPVPYVCLQNFIRYNGSNGSEFAASMERTIISDNGTVLLVEQTVPIVYPDDIRLGDAFSPQVGFFRSADFDKMYTLRSAMEPPVIPPDKVGTMDAVSVSVPILLLGGSVDRVITWNRAFPDNTYKVSFLPDANTIGRITPAIKVVNGTPVKSATGMTITVSAGLAVSVAGVLHVVATT